MNIDKMPYQITQEIKNRAKALGITLTKSKNKAKKLDAYKDGEFQASFGATGYKDYHIYKATEGAKVANEKRKQYKARHEKDRNVKYRDGKLTAGWLADNVLW
jgi:hypothetical protein